MKFKEAFDRAFEIEEQRTKQQNTKFIVSKDTAKILVFCWNMFAQTQNVLDDLVFLDNNNDFVSIPLQKSDKPKEPDSKAKRANALTGDHGEEKQKQ